MTDAPAIIRAINRAEDAHHILTGMARHNTNPTGPRVTTTSTPGVPLNLTMHDLATDIATILRELALDIADTTGEWPDELDAPGAALYARRHAEHIAGHEGWTDTVTLLQARYRTATGVLGLLPNRSPMPDPCHCGHQQWIYRERPPFVRCQEGHLSDLSQHLESRGIHALTQHETAWILDCTQSAVSKKLKRGDLTAAPTGGITVKSIRERLADSPQECYFEVV